MKVSGNGTRGDGMIYKLRKIAATERGAASKQMDGFEHTGLASSVISYEEIELGS